VEKQAIYKLFWINGNNFKLIINLNILEHTKIK